MGTLSRYTVMISVLLIGTAFVGHAAGGSRGNGGNSGGVTAQGGGNSSTVTNKGPVNPGPGYIMILPPNIFPSMAPTGADIQPQSGTQQPRQNTDEGYSNDPKAKPPYLDN